MSFATISVIGLGYIGLPTAAAFASRQKQVIGVDINQHAVDTINRGEIHIVEPDLASVVKTAVEGGFLRASTTPVALCFFGVVFLILGLMVFYTPPPRRQLKRMPG